VFGSGPLSESVIARQRTLTSMANARDRIPMNAQLLQTKGATKGTEYSPLKTRRKGPGAKKYK